MHPPPHPLQRSSRPGLVLGALAAGLFLSACSSVGAGWPGIGSLVTPHRMDIQQGNVVTRERLQMLQPGMSREQVRNVLGSPLLTSVFHAHRWDYVFTLKSQDQEPQQRRLTVFFKDDGLERFEGDELPSEAEFLASLGVRGEFGRLPALQATEEQLRAFQERNPVAPPAAAPPAVPATSFPPLESPGAGR